MQRDWSGLALICGAAIVIASLIWGDEGATQTVTTVLIAAIAGKISKDKLDAKADAADIKHAVNGGLSERIIAAVTEATEPLRQDITAIHHRLDRLEAPAVPGRDPQDPTP